MVRHSTLPERMAQGISDSDLVSALEEEELSRFGETVHVYFSSQSRQLDVTPGCPSPPSMCMVLTPERDITVFVIIMVINSGFTIVTRVQLQFYQHKSLFPTPF